MTPSRSHLRPNSLPPQLLLLLLFSLSLFSILLLLVVPTPAASHFLPHALRPSGHPHQYQPLHLFDPETNAWALKSFRKSGDVEGKEEGGEDSEKVVDAGRRAGEGGRRLDFGMVGLVLVGVGISMFLNDRRKKRRVGGVKGRLEKI